MVSNVAEDFEEHFDILDKVRLTFSKATPRDDLNRSYLSVLE
jgi:hypothetical protein